MKIKVSGSFEVSMKPIGEPEKRTGATLASMALEKQYTGDLDATGTGQVLTAITQVKGSASYVAIEYVAGNLKGSQGSFVLQHSAWRAHGDQGQTITLVPDSGTDDLKGITGSMQIRIVDGQHFYEFEYQLPE